MKPCDEVCPKCGTKDVLRRYVPEGEYWTRDVLTDPKLARERKSVEICYHVRAELIHHHCRVCQFAWVGDVSMLAAREKGQK